MSIYPKKGRKTDKVGGEPKLPVELQGALLSLYGNYEKYYRLWEQNAEARDRGITPPVFIVVCNNTNVSKLVFDFISGWEKPIGEELIAQAGSTAHLPQRRRQWCLATPPEHRPGRQPAARIWGINERRLQEDRRPRNRGIQGRIPSHASPAAMRKA